ncbi:GNAT family N-acetyltransferase [Olivibacter domesticus]|uniref:Acetyltransferase (GNAT) domain-containing protein n=1 Tax=Olivibacter domesticus TaxID=407022 RepID=A0A1H7MPA4_OLID1|nr:GNAT family N-acetyltransferase [Olivibacter domesticus]SEL12678.1 Acetyltransferase (GNAT) domain-containing protein [Olivibacter domesticus]
MEEDCIVIRIARLSDMEYINEIILETEKSAIARGIGIARRSPESIHLYMKERKAIIAVTASGEWVGFSYISVWENGRFVSNSGLIVAPRFRHTGVAQAIKERVFKLAREQYPHAQIFSITSGMAVMKMNTKLGFEPVTYQEITHDPKFWEGCKSCANHSILLQKGLCNCLCTAMLFDPDKIENHKAKETLVNQHLRIA